MLLVFVITFSSVVGMGFLENVDALKSKGNPVTSYGSSSGICGDKLCSEIEQAKSKESDHMEMESKMSDDEMMMMEKDEMMMMEKDEMMMMEKDEMMMMEKDEMMMMEKDVLDNHASADLPIKSKIKTILDQTDYSSEINTETILELSNYLSTLNESNLQQQTIKKIVDIVFYAEHDQMPLEFAIYDIYQLLE